MATFGNDRLPNPHPGEILLEEFLKPMWISRSELARALPRMRRLAGAQKAETTALSHREAMCRDMRGSCRQAPLFP